MLDALATTAWKRPGGLLLATVGLAAGLVAVALSTVPGLGLGSSHMGEERGPDIVVAAEPREPVTAEVRAIALETIAANVAADPAVESLVTVDGRGERARVEVTVAGDEADERDALERLRGDIDPGPMRVHLGGETAELQEAATDVGADVWRLELLIMPFVAAVLVGVLGWRLILAPVLSAVVASAGMLASLGVLGLVADPLVIAAIPALVVAVVGGIELSALLVARFEEEAHLAAAPRALRGALAQTTGVLGLAAMAGALGGAGLLASSLDLAGWIAIAIGLAGAWTWIAAVLATTAVFALARAGDDAPQAAPERWLARPLSAPARALARASWRTGAAAVLVIGGLAALAFWAPSSPSLGHTVPLDAADLDRASEAARASAVGKPKVDTQLVDDMPLVAALAGGLFGAAVALRFGIRALPFAAVALLPAGAAAGGLFLVFEDGTLAAELGQEPQRAVNVLALAFTVAPVAAIGAARTMTALEVVRAERALDPGTPGVAERAARLVMPGAFAASLVGSAIVGVLMAADIYAARELGLGIAAGLLLDLVLLRPVVLAAAARWGAPGTGERRRIRLPRWPARLRRGAKPTASAS